MKQISSACIFEFIIIRIDFLHFDCFYFHFLAVFCHSMGWVASRTVEENIQTQKKLVKSKTYSKFKFINCIKQLNSKHYYIKSKLNSLISTILVMQHISIWPGTEYPAKISARYPVIRLQ